MSTEINNDKLLTLTQVHKLTDISMVTLCQYKRRYQDRIPSIGSGRQQRYPESALEIFCQIFVENQKRRGRPVKSQNEEMV